MALREVPTEDSWPDEIAELAATEFNCVIDIFVPGTRGTYSSSSDTHTGGTPETVLISGRTARAQHLRLPLDGFAAGERTGRRRYRFQYEPEDGDPIITEGKSVRVTETERNETLLAYVFQVTNAGGSDHSALRTIEAVGEMAVVNG